MKNYENNTVRVLAPDDEELMPCHPARARKFINSGKATIISKHPFIIKMNEEPSSREKIGEE